MKVLFTLWISVVLIQEVVPSTLVRLPRDTKSSSSVVHTEYEAKYQQKGTNGNESSSMLSGNQKFVHDNCSENWNAFAEKCASLIKELVASLANVVSSKPGDATNLQLHIKNTFRHFDNTNNCTCLSHAGKSLSELDLSPLFNNITIKTMSPTASGKSNGLGNEHSDMHPSSSGSDPTTNSRREVKYPQVSYASHPSEHKTGTPVIDCHTTQPAVFPVTRPRHPKPTKTISTYPVSKSHNPKPFIVVPTQTVSDSRDTKRAKVADALLLSSVKHYLPSAVVAVNNSHSNIPESSTGKGDDVNTIHLSPVYDHKSSEPSSSVKLIIGESEKPCEDCDSHSGNKHESTGTSHVTPVLVYTEKSHAITSLDTTQPHRGGSDKITENIFLTTPTPFYHLNTKLKAPEIENQKSDGKPIILVSGKTTENRDEDVKSVTPVFSKLTSVAPLVTVEKSTDSEEETGHREHRTHSHIARIGHLGHLGHLGHKGHTGHTIIAVTPSIVTPQYSKTTVSPIIGKTEDKEEKGVTPAIVIPAEITLEKKPTTKDKDCNDEKGVTPAIVIPAEVTAEKKSATKDEDCDDGKRKSSHTSVVIPAAVALEKKPIKDEDCDNGKGKLSHSPVVTPAEVTLEKKSTAKDKDCDDEKRITPAVIIPAESLVVHKPEESKENSKHPSGVFPAQITVEKIPATKDKENCDGEKGTTPTVVMPVEITIEKKPATKDENCDDGKGKSGHHTTVIPAEVILEKKPTTKDKDCNDEKGVTPAIVIPAEVTAEKKSATKDEDCDDGKRKSSHSSVVIPAEVALEKKPTTKDKDCDDEKSVTPAIVIPAEVTLEKKPAGKDKDCDNEKEKSGNQTVIIPANVTLEKKSSTKHEDYDDNKGKSSHPSVVASAEITVEKIPAINDKEHSDDESRVTAAVEIPAKITAEKKPASNDKDCDDKKGNSTDNAAVMVPVTKPVEVTLKPVEKETNYDEEKGRTVTPSIMEIIKPVTVVTTGNNHGDKRVADALVIPTTFQTTSVKPTLPPPVYLLSTDTKKPSTHSSISADSDETLVEKPKRPSHHDEDDEDEDCCSCESCTEEELSDPKHFKDTACRNLEEARRELKRIFDKITKKLKCGRKAPQTITAT